MGQSERLIDQEIAQVVIIIDVLGSLDAAALIGADQPAPGPGVALGAVPRVSLLLKTITRDNTREVRKKKAAVNR